MNKKKRGGRDRPENSDINNYNLNRALVNINDIQDNFLTMEERVQDAYIAFLDINVGLRVRNVQLYWRDIRDVAYLHLKQYILDRYEDREATTGMGSFIDIRRDFIAEFYSNVNNNANNYEGELISPVYSRELYIALENFRIYLDNVKEESDNVVFDEDLMEYVVGRGEPMSEIARSEVEYHGDLLQNVLDEIEVMLDYEKNEYIFNDSGAILNNFSSEMEEGDNIIYMLEHWDRRSGILADYDTMERDMLFREYYTHLENMIANTLSRMRNEYYSDDDMTLGGKKDKKKKKIKKKVKRKSVKKTKKHKRKTKRKVYGRKR